MTDKTLSIDVGLTNLGVAVMSADGTIHHVDCIDIKYGTTLSDTFIRNLADTLAELATTHGPITTLAIEQQLCSNKMAMQLEMLIIGLVYPFVDGVRRISSNAVKRYIQCDTAFSYHRRKKYVVECAVRWLESTAQLAVLERIRTFPKQDDMCDAIMNAVYHYKLSISNPISTTNESDS